MKRKFDLLIKDRNTGSLTKFKGVELNALLRWLNKFKFESAIESNFIEGNKLHFLKHTNSQTTRILPNDNL